MYSYSEENELMAQAAYKLLQPSDPTLPEWDRYPAQHKVRDLVQTFQSNPRSHTCIANPLEQAVSDTIRMWGTLQETGATIESLGEMGSPKPKTTKTKK